MKEESTAPLYKQAYSGRKVLHTQQDIDSNDQDSITYNRTSTKKQKKSNQLFLSLSKAVQKNAPQFQSAQKLSEVKENISMQTEKTLTQIEKVLANRDGATDHVKAKSEARVI